MGQVLGLTDSNGCCVIVIDLQSIVLAVIAGAELNYISLACALVKVLRFALKLVPLLSLFRCRLKAGRLVYKSFLEQGLV